MRPEYRKKTRRKPSNHAPNNPNKAFDSNGPRGHIRGTARQLTDRYLEFARDAGQRGDRVAEQSCLQYAEHYARLALMMSA